MTDMGSTARSQPVAFCVDEDSEEPVALRWTPALRDLRAGLRQVNRSSPGQLLHLKIIFS